MIYLIAFLGLGLSLSISGAQAFYFILIAVALVHLANRIRKARKANFHPSRMDPLAFSLIVFSGWVFIVSYFTGTTSFGDAVKVLSPVVLYFLIVFSFPDENWEKGVRWFVYGSVAVGALALVQASTGISYENKKLFTHIPSWFEAWPKGLLHYIGLKGGRATGTRSHPLTYAESLLPPFLLLLTFLGTRLFEKKDSWRSNWSLLIGLVCLALGLLLSQSRGAWIAASAGAALILARWPWRTQAAIWGITVVMLGGIFIYSPQYRQRMLSIVSTERGGANDQESNRTRLQLWTQSLQQIKERPVLGYGPRGTKILVPDTTGVQRQWSQSHNIYLQIPMDAGLVGLGLLIWSFVIIVKMLLLLPKDERTLFLAIFVSFLISGLTESWTHDSVVLLIFFGYLGLLGRRCQSLRAVARGRL